MRRKSTWGLAGEEEGSGISRPVEERTLQLVGEQTTDRAREARVIHGINGSGTWDDHASHTAAACLVRSVTRLNLPTSALIAACKSVRKGCFLQTCLPSLTRSFLRLPLDSYRFTKHILIEGGGLLHPEFRKVALGIRH